MDPMGLEFDQETCEKGWYFQLEFFVHRISWFKKNMWKKRRQPKPSIKPLSEIKGFLYLIHFDRYTVYGYTIIYLHLADFYGFALDLPPTQ